MASEQPHYPSPMSDLDQTASQQEFGHPYAFLGIPGIGATKLKSTTYTSCFAHAAELWPRTRTVLGKYAIGVPGGTPGQHF